MRQRVSALITARLRGAGLESSSDVITNDQSALLTDFKSPYIPPKNWRLAPRKVNGRKIIPSVEKPRRFSLRPASIPLKAIENGKKYGTPSAPLGDQYYDEPEDDNGAS